MDSTPLLITKLYRPQVTNDLELRTGLLGRLDQNRHRPLTLISAPAGYGKSTLASLWLEATDSPSAWISLDEEDSSLSSFMAYLLAALHQLFPGTKLHTEELLQTPALPTSAVIVRFLLNDLEQVRTPFILVLDDLHQVRESAVIDVLIELLRHPTRKMHLVVISRQDPPLPLTTLRARRQVTEIRSRDLRFTVEETIGLLTKALRREVDENTARAWMERTEGWVTALHLAALSLSHRGLDEGLAPAETVGGGYVHDFLIAEVLAHLPPGRLKWLLATSLVDRFCASLCEALLRPGGGDEAKGDGLSGEEFVRWLQEANLFVVVLDAERRWFRFHDLFRQLLRDALARTPETVDPVTVHKRASRWFTDNDLIEEAIQHSLAAGDVDAAIQLVAQHRHELMNTDQWHQLDRWLRLFPEDAVANDPFLTLTQARLPAAYGQNQYLLVARAGSLATSLQADAPTTREVIGELAYFTALEAVLAGPGEKAIKEGAKAFSLLPPQARQVLCSALGVQAIGYQMSGDYRRGIRLLEEALSTQPWSLKDRIQLLMIRSFVSLLEGDLPTAQLSVHECLRQGAEIRAWYTIGQAHYIAGLIHYLRNELAEAEAHFLTLVENRVLVDSGYLAHAVCALLRIYHARREFEEANGLLQLITLHLQGPDNAWSLEVLRGFEVELALDLGDITAAERLAPNVNFEDFRPIWFYYLLQLTPIKLLLAQRAAVGLVRGTRLAG